jgi:PAS domain S-box-containing protein
MENDRNSARKQDSVNLVTDQGTQHSTSRSRQKNQPGIYEHLPMGVVEVSRDDRFLSVNAEFCRLLGYERQELLLLGIEDVTHKDDYPTEVQLLDQLLTGKIPFYKLEKRFIRKDGQIISTELTRSMVPAARGKPAHTIGVVLDIAERQRAEGILAGFTRQQQALYQLVQQLD